MVVARTAVVTDGAAEENGLKNCGNPARSGRCSRQSSMDLGRGRGESENLLRSHRKK